MLMFQPHLIASHISPKTRFLSIIFICSYIFNLYAIVLMQLGATTVPPLRSFEVAGVLGVPNGSTMVPGEGRNRKLNSELANGRLVT